jgi:acyl-CoA thioesterase I
MVAVSCSPTGAPTAPSDVAPPSVVQRRIVVLGDSLAVSPSAAESFPAELQRRLTASYPGWLITNASVSGDTTAGGLQRVDEALTADTRILVLELGANDGLRGVPIATIEKNLSTMIERAQARGIRVLLCGMETPPSHGFGYSVDFHLLFPRLADMYHVALVPFLLTGVVLNPDLNGEDAVHPNAAGARRVADTVWPYLDALVREESRHLSAIAFRLFNPAWKSLPIMLSMLMNTPINFPM